MLGFAGFPDELLDLEFPMADPTDVDENSETYVTMLNDMYKDFSETSHRLQNRSSVILSGTAAGFGLAMSISNDSNPAALVLESIGCAFLISSFVLAAMCLAPGDTSFPGSYSWKLIQDRVKLSKQEFLDYRISSWCDSVSDEADRNKHIANKLKIQIWVSAIAIACAVVAEMAANAFALH